MMHIYYCTNYYTRNQKTVDINLTLKQSLGVFEVVTKHQVVLLTYLITY